MTPTPAETIDRLLREMSVLKQDVFHLTIDTFHDFKLVLQEVIKETSQKFGDTDKRVEIYYRDRGDFQAEIKVGSDILIFQMHTNVFQFDNTHPLWKSGYFKDNDKNSYVGIINIYNFLSDSIRYQRQWDMGYLIGRVFVNRERHFMVQGKRQLGYLFNDMINSELTKEKIKEVVHSAILYTLDFDLLVPPYENLQEITLEQIQSISQSHSLATGKRLGFRFGLEDGGL
jgi:hypothetical protein